MIKSKFNIANEKILKNVLVFKTNVFTEEESKMIVYIILDQFPTHKVNFDLDDCDNILRIEGVKISPIKVINIMMENQYQCCLLE